MFKKEDLNSEFIVQCKIKCFSSFILQLQNTTSSNQVKLPKKYVKSTLKLSYENLINNKLSKLDQKSKLGLNRNPRWSKIGLRVTLSYLGVDGFKIHESCSDSDKLLKI
jgi:hypothetical protein